MPILDRGVLKRTKLSSISRTMTIIKISTSVPIATGLA